MCKPIQHHEHPSGLIDGSVSYFTASVSPTRKSIRDSSLTKRENFYCVTWGLEIGVTMEDSICITSIIYSWLFFEIYFSFYLWYFTRRKMNTNRKNKAWIHRFYPSNIIEYYTLDISVVFFLLSSHEKNFCQTSTWKRRYRSLIFFSSYKRVNNLRYKQLRIHKKRTTIFLMRRQIQYFSIRNNVSAQKPCIHSKRVNKTLP